MYIGKAALAVTISSLSVPSLTLEDARNNSRKLNNAIQSILRSSSVCSFVGLLIWGLGKTRDGQHP